MDPCSGGERVVGGMDESMRSRMGAGRGHGSGYALALGARSAVDEGVLRRRGRAGGRDARIGAVCEDQPATAEAST
jgi:hypothetical protein